MSSRVATYESDAVRVIFAGLSLEDGRAEKFCKITAHGPAYTVEGPGADGLVTRCGTNDRLYTVELTFKGSSAELSRLAAIHAVDRAATNGAGIAPLMIEDGNGSSLYATDRAWITTDPEKEFGMGPSDVTVELHAVFPAGTALVGGN